MPLPPPAPGSPFPDRLPAPVPRAGTRLMHGICRNILRSLGTVLLGLGLCGFAAAEGAVSDAWTVAFTGTAQDRDFRDYPLAFPGGGATEGAEADGAGGAPHALALTIRDFPTNGAVRAVTVHLRAGGGWYSAPVPLEHPGTVRIPLHRFQPEGEPAPVSSCDTLRLSLWRGTLGAGAFAFSAAWAQPEPVAILRATARTAPGSESLAGDMAMRCARLLDKAGIPFEELEDTLETIPGSVQWLFLPYSPELPAPLLRELLAYLKRGGKLFVFYQANARLARACGIRAGPWRGGGESGWSAMTLHAPLAEGARIPHITGNLLPPYPAEEDSKATIVAHWLDDTGRNSRLPAITLSPCGAWFAHIPPAAYPAAVQTVATLLRQTGYTPPAAPAAVAPQTPALGLTELRRAFPLRGVWLTAPEPRSRRGWRDTLPGLSALGLNTVFAQLGPTLQPAYTRKTDRWTPADLQTALREAEAEGVTLHAWVHVFSTEGAGRRATASLPKSAWLPQAEGRWLDPAATATHEKLIAPLLALARAGVPGIHFDYIRTPDGVPATPETTRAVTAFLRRASAALRKINPGIVLSAAVFPTPEAAALRNQDWPAWLREQLVDFVCPMIYTENPSSFEAQLRACRAVADAEALVPGIGTGAGESQVSGAVFRHEVRACFGLRGVAFFALDDALLDVLNALD